MKICYTEYYKYATRSGGFSFGSYFVVSTVRLEWCTELGVFGNDVHEFMFLWLLHTKVLRREAALTRLRLHSFIIVRKHGVLYPYFIP